MRYSLGAVASLMYPRGQKTRIQFRSPKLPVKMYHEAESEILKAHVDKRLGLLTSLDNTTWSKKGPQPDPWDWGLSEDL